MRNPKNLRIKFVLIILFFSLISCGKKITINDKLEISRWNDEGYSLNFNDHDNWLGVVGPDITSYDLQNNILILERASENDGSQYYLINLDSLNHPKDLTDSTLTRKEFKNKIGRLKINYYPKKL
ncbi:hypothetical protein ASG31_16635 [Chryseobacterium sp. Leaf404]|uniref:hypothetical protein n=1 Tax=unclassified Chryseobacterium TaxID=2593645 RepID=UPI0006FD19B9|nr:MULTISPECIES: hypothetical protein [unclassified Chryseobacterium]KQT21500.1 hypothetical protein ASG31_16635 [Chryseobacterium sp. Leaf404]